MEPNSPYKLLDYEISGHIEAVMIQYVYIAGGVGSGSLCAFDLLVNVCNTRENTYINVFTTEDQ